MRITGIDQSPRNKIHTNKNWSPPRSTRAMHYYKFLERSRWVCEYVSMWVVKPVVHLGSYLKYEHALRRKLLNKYLPDTRAAVVWLCWCCLGRNLRTMLQRFSVNKIVQLGLYLNENFKECFPFAKLAEFSLWRKLHKCSLVFKYLNNLVPKYLTEYFIRNKALDHDYGTRRSNDLHPPKPMTNMGKRTFKYAGTIHFNWLPAHIKTAPSFSNFTRLLIEHYYQ